jgi:hypothetical protein
MSKHLTFNEDYLVAGNVHFSAKDVKADRLGATGIYAADHYAKPALVPAMPHLPAEPLMFPVITGAHRDASGATTLTWQDMLDGHGPFGSTTGYAVYRFGGTDPTPGPCGFADATHLLATQRATGSGSQTLVDTTAEPGQRYTYFVSALDRLWNESPPSPPRPVTG